MRAKTSSSESPARLLQAAKRHRFLFLLQIPLSVLTLGCFVFGTVATAKADPSLTFLDEAPISVELDAEGNPTPDEFAVVVLHQGAVATVSMELIGLPRTAFVIELTRGSVSRFEFTLTASNNIQTGSGTLVATSSDGAVARRPINVLTSGTPALPPPSKLTFTGWHWFPFVQQSATVRGLVDPSLAADAERIVGRVSSGNGHTGDIVLTTEGITIRGITQAGEYSGSATLIPGIDSSKIEVTVKIRDFWAYPLAVLLAGLAIAWLMDRYSKLGAPGYRLLIRFRRTQERATKARQDARKTLAVPLKGLGKLDLPRVTGVGLRRRQLLLDSAADRGYADWIGALDDDERASWKSGGDNLKAYDKLASDYQDLLDRLVIVSQRYSATRAHATALMLEPELDTSPCSRNLAEVARTGDIVSEADLRTLGADVDVCSKAFDDLEQQLDLLLGYAVKNPSHKTKATNLAKDILRTPPNGLADELTKVLALIHAGKAASTTAARGAGEPEEPRIARSRSFWKPPDVDDYLRDESSILLTHAYKKSMRNYLILGGLITVLGGMAAVYFPSPAFGSLGDYVSVLLWGTAVGTGADVAAKILAAR